VAVASVWSAWSSDEGWHLWATIISRVVEI